MNSFFIYLLKVAAGLSLFVIPYYFLLRNDNNLELKRIYLMVSIIISFLFPLSGIDTRGIVELNSPVYFLDPGQYINIETVALPEGKNAGNSLMSSFLFLYIGGILLLLSRNLVLLFRWKSLNKTRDKGLHNVTYTDSEQIFTLFNRIFLPHNLAGTKDAVPIIIHENAHIRQMHFIDLLLVETALLLTWFNPFTWLISRMIRENHEHLADKEVLAAGVNPAHYRAQLVNQVLGVPVFNLGHQFNYSLTKKRFEMMKTKRSSVAGIIKLMLLVPLILFAFGFVTGYAQGTVIKGKVILADTGEPATGAAIVIENTDVGTLANEDGKFNLEALQNTSLVISHVGYETKRLKASPGKDVSVYLEKRNIIMDPQQSKPESEKEKPAIKPDVSSDLDEEDVFIVVEQMPEFPGGEAAMKEYLSNNVKKLPDSKGKGVEGTVYVQYTINEEGKVVDPLVVKSTNELFNEAAIDVIKNMPDWTPGIQRGKKVSVNFTTPIRFIPAGG